MEVSFNYAERGWANLKHIGRTGTNTPNNIQNTTHHLKHIENWYLALNWESAHPTGISYADGFSWWVGFCAGCY